MAFVKTLALDSGFTVDLQFRNFSTIDQISLCRYGIKALTVFEGDFSFFGHPENPTFQPDLSNENSIVFHRQVFSRIVGDKIWRTIKGEFKRENPTEPWVFEIELMD